MNRLLLVLISGTALPVWAAEAPLSALITHERNWLTADGVQHRASYQERLYRNEQHVWIERVFPPTVKKLPEDKDHDHKHVSFDTAPRWVTRKADGQLRVQYLNLESHNLIEVTPRDYESVAFDGSWANTRNLITPEGKGWQTTTIGKETWQVYQTKQGTTKVLWDKTHNFPATILREDGTGTASMKATVQWLPTPAQWPWQKLPKLETIDYSDTLD